MERLYEIPLDLTTPEMTGSKVETAQLLLSGKNAYRLTPHPVATFEDVVDGVYGPLTAGATKRAKYWLGYPLSRCDYVFGQALYENLRVEAPKPLPLAFRRRRDARIKQVVTQSLSQKALGMAKTQLGVREDPANSNLQPYGKWYGVNGVPWCAIFTSWCFSRVNGAFRYAYVPFAERAAELGDGMHLVDDPEPGDLVTYTIGGVPGAHIAFFDGWIDRRGTFYDVGGNTGPRDISNGGAVLRQARGISLVHRFIRVDR